MTKTRILELMAKKFSSDASKEELDELAALFVQYPDYAYLHEVVLSLKGSKSHFEKDIPKEELVNHGWEHLAGKLNIHQLSTDEKQDETGTKSNLKKIIYFRKFWMVAAIAVIIIGSGLFYYKEYFSRQQLAASKKIAEVHYGTTSKLTLSDGSQVWLNAGSKLIYPEKFSATQREVTLDGEGFFEVTKNVHLPFLVHAGKITVRVLGTKFNVKAYSEDPAIETTLISGKVQVILNDDPEKEIVLSPNEKLTVSNAKNNKPSSPDQASNELKFQVQSLPAASSTNLSETAWLNNKLIFSNESLINVARMLERKYAVHINFQKEELKDEYVTGMFEKENIQQALDLLKMTTHFNYVIKRENISLY